MNAAQAKAKISALQNLIDHPKTGDAEKQAAKRALTRIRGHLGSIQPAERASWEPWFKGAKYEETKGLYRTSDLTKLIREDLKLAVKISKAPAAPGDLAATDPFAVMPAGVKFSVTTPHHGSIRIRITGAPKEWAYAEKWSDLYRENMTLPTGELCDLSAAVRDIANAYNYDDSDIMTDYHNTRFYVYVTDETGVSLGRRR